MLTPYMVSFFQQWGVTTFQKDTDHQLQFLFPPKIGCRRGNLCRLYPSSDWQTASLILFLGNFEKEIHTIRIQQTYAARLIPN